MRPTVQALVLLGLLSGCARAPEPVFDARLPQGRLRLPLAELSEPVPFPEGREALVSELGRDARSSHHSVWIRDRETPHRHDRHDLLVVILRGYGMMRIDAEERPLGEGSILYVPRGTVHAFRNTSGAPALAYAVYVPAFDGKDRINVD